MIVLVSRIGSPRRKSAGRIPPRWGEAARPIVVAWFRSAIVGGSVERRVESAPPSLKSSGIGFKIAMLGPLSLARNGIALELPTSRKVRALLAYLALSPRPVGRGRLCELLWDGPDDPRGELRWCLSKLRGVLDEPGRGRV